MVPVGVVAECVAIKSRLTEIVQTFEILPCVLVVSPLVMAKLIVDGKRVATSVCVTEIMRSVVMTVAALAPRQVRGAARKRSELMRNLSRLFLAPTLAAVLLGLASAPSNAARRVGGSAYDGTWSVAIYTLRGDCGSVRAAVRIIGGRVYSADQSYQAGGGVSANGAVRVSVAGFGRSASGSGRLSRNSGAGRWRSSRGECSGSWSASRRAGYY
jgi:hypothetical protein